MVVGEYFFSEYYHKFITIEADELTANLSCGIKISEKDCYCLCSCYVDQEGMICFNVLSVGESWENCTRGLRRKEMLGTFTIDDVFAKEMRIADANYQMIHKNNKFLEEKEKNIDEDIIKSRLDQRLDLIRDPYYADIVFVGVFDGKTLHEYPMKIMGIKGPFLMGEMLEEPMEEVNIHGGETIYALPYIAPDGFHLLTLFGGEKMNPEDKKTMNEIIRQTSHYGFDFNGISLKN